MSGFSLIFLIFPENTFTWRLHVSSCNLTIQQSPIFEMYGYSFTLQAYKTQAHFAVGMFAQPTNTQLLWPLTAKTVTFQFKNPKEDREHGHHTIKRVTWSKPTGAPVPLNPKFFDVLFGADDFGRFIGTDGYSTISVSVNLKNSWRFQ